MDTGLQQIIERFYRINNLTNQMQNHEVCFDGCPPLRTASIHLIEMIGNHPDAHAKQLADILGVTKGAVSQMASKLAEKNLIRASKTGREVSYELTSLGRDVFKAHEHLHKDMYEKLSSSLSGLSEHDVKKIVEVMDEVAACIKAYGHGV